MLRYLFRVCCTSFLGIILCTALRAHAQNANSDLPPMYWYSRHDPVGIGQGVEISTQGMGGRNNPFDLDAAMAAGQIVRGAPQTLFESHDFSKTENILNNLKVNVFAEVGNALNKGSFSLNYNKLISNNIDERKWEVDAIRIQTYSFKKDPRISASAKAAMDPTQGGSSANFRSLYGNYFVSGITYRRRLRVRFTCQISKQVSEQDLRVAIAASGSCFSAKADMTSLNDSLSKIGSTSIEIEIDGLDGAQVISVASKNDLIAMRDSVAELLSHFDDIPNQSGVEPVPGIPDQVKLRHFSTILPIQIDPFKTPNEDSLNVAFSDYIRIDRLRNRLVELSGRNYNTRLRTYLTQKAAEVEIKRNTLVSYMQRLALNPTTYIPRPNTQVSFEDPEVMRWQFTRSEYSQVNSSRYDLHLYFTVIGEVSTYISGYKDSTIDKNILTDGTTTLPIVDQKSNMFQDPVTGITKRLIDIVWSNGGGHAGDALRTIMNNAGRDAADMWYVLRTTEGSQYFLSTDLAGARQTIIKLPFAVYRP